MAPNAEHNELGDMTPTLALLAALVQAPPAWAEAPPLPTPIANNAVAAVRTLDGPAVFTFLGIDSTKAWDGRPSIALRWDVGSADWRPVRAVQVGGPLGAYFPESLLDTPLDYATFDPNAEGDPKVYCPRVGLVMDEVIVLVERN